MRHRVPCSGPRISDRKERLNEEYKSLGRNMNLQQQSLNASTLFIRRTALLGQITADSIIVISLNSHYDFHATT